MENKLTFQKNLYRVFFAASMILAVCGTALSACLYFVNYEAETGVFLRDGVMTAYYVLSAVAILGAIVMSFVPVFSMASGKLPKSGGLNILVNSFCGFFVVAYTVLEILGKREQGSDIPVWLLVMALCSVIGSLYFHYQTISSKPNKTTIAIFGMFMIIFVIINIYAVHYTASDILLNAPIRIGSLVAMTAIMMFLINEIRYHFEIANPKVYFAFAMLTAFFGLSDSVPRILLSVMGKNGFETGSATLLLCFEFFTAVYAIIRLTEYLKSGMFVMTAEKEESSEEIGESDILGDNVAFDSQDVDDVGTDDNTENVENDENAEESGEETEYDSFTDFKGGDQDDNDDVLPDEAWDLSSEQTAEGSEQENSEETAEDGMTGESEINTDDGKTESDDLSSDFSKDADDNDLPDDCGFEGGNEGEFEVEGFAMVEDSVGEIDEDDDDDDIDVEAHPLAVLGIDEDEFDNLAADEGEIIDYEELKSASAENISIEGPNTSHEEDDDDEDDSVIEMDIMTVLSHDEEKNEKTEEKTQEKNDENQKGEKKSFVQKFKFVKKL